MNLAALQLKLQIYLITSIEVWEIHSSLHACWTTAAFFVFLFFKCVFKRRHFSRFHFVFFSLKVKAKSDVLTSHLWNISFWFLWTDSELVCQIKYLPIQMTYKANIKGRFKGPASENTLNHAVKALIHPFIWNFSWGPYLNTEKLI